MKLFVALTAAALFTAPSLAAPCRDAKGKFVKCPPAATTTAVTKGKDGKCRDAKGHFAKCAA
jgi:hypothetical protein